MRRSLKISFIFSSILFIFFVAFTILLTNINVSNVGPLNSKVGLAFINDVMFKLFGASSLFDKLSDILLILSFLMIVAFIALGIYQLIKRKSFKKVDSELYILALIYILIAICFVVFEIVEINYRPVLVDGKLEASYPSTHVLIIFTVFATAIFMLKNYIKNKTLRSVLTSICYLFMLASVIFRLFSGMHWFTDILGALILSTALTTLFKAFDILIKEKRNTKKRTDE